MTPNQLSFESTAISSHHQSRRKTTFKVRNSAERRKYFSVGRHAHTVELRTLCTLIEASKRYQQALSAFHSARTIHTTTIESPLECDIECEHRVHTRIRGGAIRINDTLMGVYKKV